MGGQQKGILYMFPEKYRTRIMVLYEVTGKGGEGRGGWGEEREIAVL